MIPSVAERLAAGASANDNGCLSWTRCVNSQGYGQISVGGKVLMTHRVAWELANGPIPPKMTIDHLCRNIRCINVAHLEVVTLAENIRRGAEARRAERAERSPRARTECRRGHAWIPENLTRGGRCNPCLRDRRHGLHGVPSGSRHGRVSTYSDYGCRCGPCAAANAVRSAEQTLRRRAAAAERANQAS